MTVKLDPHQVKGAAFLAEGRYGLLWWDPGVGKTFAALEAVRLLGEEFEKPASVLVLCPAVARRNWVREAYRIMHAPKCAVIETRADIKPASVMADIRVASYDLVSRYPDDFKDAFHDFDVLILDEMQYLKSHTSKRTKHVIGKRGLHLRAGAVWALSGTPAPNNLGEFYPWLKATTPDVEPLRYDEFIGRVCRVRQTDYGYQITGNAPHGAELVTRWLDHDVSRLRIEDVIRDLPPVRYSTYRVDAAGRVEIGEDEAIAMRAAAENGEDATALATIRYDLEMSKVADATAFIDEKLSEGAQKVAVFGWHQDALDAVAAAFNTVPLYGPTPPAKRQQLIDGFQDGGDRVFVGQIQAAGTAITLHANGRCRDVVFLSASWVPGDNRQAVARVARRGQPFPVAATFLAVEGSIDGYVTDVLRRKTEMIGELEELV